MLPLRYGREGREGMFSLRRCIGAISNSCLPGGENDNRASILLAGSGDSSKGDGLTSLGRRDGHVPQVVEQRRIADGGLGKECGLGHHGNRLDGVVTLGGLSGKHDTVGTVENGVGDIGDLSTGRSGVVLKRY